MEPVSRRTIPDYLMESAVFSRHRAILGRNSVKHAPAHKALLRTRVRHAVMRMAVLHKTLLMRSVQRGKAAS